MNARPLLKCLVLFLLLVCCFPRPAMAYVGPGTGMTAVGVFLAVVMGVVVAIFGFDVVTECPNVPSEILVPRNAWADKAAYEAAARKLSDLFKENFKKYEAGASSEVKAAAPIA